MRLTTLQKRLISGILILLLSISGIWTEKSQTNVFSAWNQYSQKRNVAQKSIYPGKVGEKESREQSLVYKKIQLSQREYARIEETGIKTLQNISRVSGVNRAEQGKGSTSDVYDLLDAPLSLSKYQINYSVKCCFFHLLQGMGWQTIISYIHRKDGAKG